VTKLYANDEITRFDGTVYGSGIRDAGSGMGKNQDPRSGINIPDPPHWVHRQGKPNTVHDDG